MKRGDKLDGRVAVVTGAGSGIGRAIAERFAREGCSVVVNDYDEASARETVERIEADGGAATLAAGDMSSPADVSRVVEAAREAYGRLDVLVNNAAIFDEFRHLLDTSDELWDRVMAVNVTGPFHAMRAALPTMMEGGGGAVINVSSIAGLIGGAGGAAYTASKHALIGLTRQAAVAYSERGIRANVICPGAVQTGMLPEETLADRDDPLVQKLLSVPVRRVGQADEIAGLALFLASEEAPFLVGEAITIDGGWTVQA